jgi:hypothetical protein
LLGAGDKGKDRIRMAGGGFGGGIGCNSRACAHVNPPEYESEPLL